MTIRAKLLFLLLPPLAAFLLLAAFFYYFNWSRDILLMGSGLTLLLVIGTVFIIADRLSKPVRQLNKAALGIAAGDYETHIQVEGPKEIVELAHTLNTMSQCLVEHMSRLRESSLIRERMYGEYECALLLQHYMLQKVIEEFQNTHMSMRLISIPSSPLKHGLLLKIHYPSKDDLTLTLLEAQETGFSGLFQLNQWGLLPINQNQDKAFVECQFLNQYRQLRYSSHILFPPLVWSMKKQEFISAEENKTIPIENQDMVFLYNQSVIEHFETQEAIEIWFGRVLRHFAEDGLESIQLMLTNELTFLAKKQDSKHNFKIVGMQIKLGG